MLSYNARYYDAGVGRFVSADTVVPGADALTVTPLDAVSRGAWKTAGGGPVNPQNLNRYSYGLNNPVRNTDPSGHCIPGIGDCRPFWEGGSYTGWDDFTQYSAGVVEGMGAPGAAVANLFKSETWEAAGKGAQALVTDLGGSLNVLKQELVEAPIASVQTIASDPTKALASANNNPRAIGQVLGGTAGTLAMVSMAQGREIDFGDKGRIAPLGNRTGNQFGELPHYHRRVLDTKGNVVPGQGMKRHRPWETKSTDTSFWDRF